jgi:glycosyltransferase involved in cell wall biosynthesis
VYPWCCIGGAERIMTQLSLGLRRRQVVSEACFLEDGGGKDYLRTFCPTVILDEVRGERSRAQALADLIREGGYQLIHYSFVQELAEAVELASFSGSLVEVDHGWPERCQADRVHPQALVTVSRYQAQLLADSGVRMPARVIYNGVDSARIHSRVSALAAVMDSPRRPLIAWVGRISPVKRPLLFLELVAQLSEQGVEADFCMACGVGPYAQSQEIEATLEAACAYPRLRLFAGMTPGCMPAVYAAVRASGGVVVMTSQDEPFGLVAPEAMAAGIPVIASRSGGIPEIIEEGVDGCLVEEPYSAAEACRKVMELLSDRDRYAAVSQRGQEKIERHFRRDTMVDQYWQLFASLPGWEKAPAST